MMKPRLAPSMKASSSVAVLVSGPCMWIPLASSAQLPPLLLLLLRLALTPRTLRTPRAPRALPELPEPVRLAPSPRKVSAASLP